MFSPVSYECRLNYMDRWLYSIIYSMAGRFVGSIFQLYFISFHYNLKFVMKHTHGISTLRRHGSMIVLINTIPFDLDEWVDSMLLLLLLPLLHSLVVVVRTTMMRTIIMAMTTVILQSPDDNLDRSKFQSSLLIDVVAVVVCAVASAVEYHHSPPLLLAHHVLL